MLVEIELATFSVDPAAFTAYGKNRIPALPGAPEDVEVLKLLSEIPPQQ